MNQRSQRWTILRFVFGCAYRSTPALENQSRPNPATQTCNQDIRPSDNPCTIKKTKHPLGFKLPKANLSFRIRRFIRSLKNAPRLLVYKYETVEETDDDDEIEVEIEIGYPTDVKHLTHIGWDGSTTVPKTGKQWESTLTPSEIISFPSISLEQFELAMAKQAAGATANKNI